MKSESELMYSSVCSYPMELNLLSKWKVIPLGVFYNVVPKKLNKTYSYRLADKLLKANVAHKIKNLGGRFHVLVPNPDALTLLNQNFSWSMFDEYCRSAFIGSAFFELPAFRNRDICFSHEDAQSGGRKNDLLCGFSLVGLERDSAKDFFVGVFFDVKSPHFEMVKFLESKKYSVIIVIFSSLHALHKFREQYSQQLRDLICLVLISDYLKHPHEINNSYVLFDGEEGTLLELFS